MLSFMAYSNPFSRPHLDRFARSWPLLVVVFLGVFYLARLQFSSSPLLCRTSHDPASLSFAKSVSDDLAHGNKLPPTLTAVLIHYATSTITPQQNKEEISVTANILSRRGPCNFLVFGLGFDSPLWQALNLGGRTVFLEEDVSWIAQMAERHPHLKAYHVNYTTALSKSDALLAEARKEKQICGPDQSSLQHSNCTLALKTLPAEIYTTKWDVIMIDAPRGYFPEAPGRMSAIFSSSVMARGRNRSQSTDILVHDVDRPVEKIYCTEFLCSENRLHAVGRLWHFQIFGEGQIRSKEFCTGYAI